MGCGKSKEKVSPSASTGTTGTTGTLTIRKYSTNPSEVPRKSNVLNWFTIILRVLVVLIAITNFLYGVHIFLNMLIYKMRVEGLILFGLYTCEQVIEEGEGIFVTYYFVVHGTLSLLLLYVVSAHTSIILIFWIVSLFSVGAYYAFAHSHTIVGFSGMEPIQINAVVSGISLMAAISISMVVILFYYCHLNNYQCLVDRERHYRSGRILNREILCKRMDRFTRIQTASNWGGKIQAIALIQKLQVDNRPLTEPTDEEVQFDLDNALFAFSQVQGLPNLKFYREIESDSDSQAEEPVEHVRYLRDDYRHNARTFPKCNCNCCHREPKNKIHPKRRESKKKKKSAALETGVSVPASAFVQLTESEVSEVSEGTMDLFAADAASPVGITSRRRNYKIVPDSDVPLLAKQEEDERNKTATKRKVVTMSPEVEDEQDWPAPPQ